MREAEEAVEAQAKPKGRVFPLDRVVKSSSRKETVKSEQSEWEEAFAEFWKEYPRRTCRFDARKSFLRIKPCNQETCDDIFAGLDRWNAYWLEHGTDKRYMPHPATWLNQHRWEDDPE